MEQPAGAPFGMARAVDCLASSFLTEVDQRCQAIECRLREHLVSEVFSHCVARIDDRLTAVLSELGAELRKELQGAVHAETAKLLKEAPRSVDSSLKSRGASRSHSPRGHSPRSHSPSRPHSSRAAGRHTSRGPASMLSDAQSGGHLQDLRAHCEAGMGRLQSRLDKALEVVSRMDLASNANFAEMEELCSDHMAATRKALQEMRTAEGELRNKLLVLEEHTHNDCNRHGVDSALQEQVQSQRDQLLNLSMRVSELAMSTDGRALQSLSEECHEELQRHMQAVRRVEQKVDRTAQSGRQVLDRLRRQHAEVAQRHLTSQQALEADFRKLLEELRQNAVFVDGRCFRCIGAGCGDGAAGESSCVAELNVNDDLCKTM